MASAMRRHANVRAMGHAAPKPITFPDAQGAELPEGHNSLSVQVGEERPVSGGVFDHGTYEEDGPGTWEALASPRLIPVLRRAGDPSPTHDTLGERTCRRPQGTEQALRIEVGHRQGEPEPWPTEAGSRRAAYERGRRGTGGTPGPGRAKAARVDGDLQERTMPNALTLESMSPELVKVVET